jgi:hypothetical protein
VNPKTTCSGSLEIYDPYLFPQNVSKIHMHLQFIAACPKHERPFFGHWRALGVNKVSFLGWMCEFMKWCPLRDDKEFHAQPPTHFQNGLNTQLSQLGLAKRWGTAPVIHPINCQGDKQEGWFCDKGSQLQ